MRSLRVKLVGDNLAFDRWLTLEELEDGYVQFVLSRTSTRAEAARVLGIDRKTLYRKLERSAKTPAKFDQVDDAPSPDQLGGVNFGAFGHSRVKQTGVLLVSASPDKEGT